jgi:hypothetical protein
MEVIRTQNVKLVEDLWRKKVQHSKNKVNEVDRDMKK